MNLNLGKLYTLVFIFGIHREKNILENKKIQKSEKKDVENASFLLELSNISSLIVPKEIFIWFPET